MNLYKSPSSSWINFLKDSLVFAFLDMRNFLLLDYLLLPSFVESIFCFIARISFRVFNFYKILHRPEGHLHSWHVCEEIHI